MLTQKQMQLLQLIAQRLNETGVPPSFEEMKVELGLRSKSGIHRLITALEDRGFIRRLPNRARAIEILQMPKLIDTSGAIDAGLGESGESGGSGSGGSGSGDADDAGANLRLVHNKVSQKDTSVRALAAGLRLAEAANAVQVPLMGRIAAGTPIEAIQDVANNVAVPEDMLRPGGRHYALEVKGDSMTGAGINDGDIVVINEQNDAETGDIVVALINGQEATLKRLRKRGSAIALEAANPAYETRVYHDNQVKIQGKLVGLIRTY